MFQISLTYSTRWKTNFPSPNSQIQSYPQKMSPKIFLFVAIKGSNSRASIKLLYSQKIIIYEDLFNFLSICIGLIDTNRYCSCVYISCNVAIPPPFSPSRKVFRLGIDQAFTQFILIVFFYSFLYFFWIQCLYLNPMKVGGSESMYSLGGAHAHPPPLKKGLS